ncbi:glucose 1,6-bisphosphate synthase-like isoform X1 [Asterias rubens]|uniref:glucose 1,6-bisphosphate synthase-like isoform X1 n=2 Tax=Asterias rubens TaxID=7604 RepID=UPI001455CBF1|nr:glucose 1,6-bisphosphate synthase-like isoform X1 [Asterias rubens]
MAVHVDTGDAELDCKIQQWLEWDKNMSTRQEVTELVSNHCVKELHDRFDVRVAFGTAGLRAGMEAGPARINDLTIIQTSQGLLRYVESMNPECKSQGIVIGYDARHCSRRFADLTAAIFLNAGVRVFLFSKIVPTPFVAYAIKRYKAATGVMVTPSHNPKGDNGYKVYWENGAQIISPHDKGIASSIESNLEPWKSSWDTSLVESNPLKTDPLDDIMEAYLADLQNKIYDRDLNTNCPVRITYTAMHGVGTAFVKKSFDAVGLPPLIDVVEQVDPDPDFPTVKYPNPEEGKSALDLAIRTANANTSNVIFANDPDADRFALAEKQPNDNWKIFTGNELGAVLGWWQWVCYMKNNPQCTDGKDVYMLASTVSSKILSTISLKEGFQFEETLTGFKWMGNKADELIKQGKTVLFAFEEAIGFMCGTDVLDKDGVSAATMAGQLAAFLTSTSTTFTEKLQEIYQTYGFHCSNNSYYLCMNPATMTNIFNRIRAYDDGQYPSSCGSFQITGIRDLTTGFDSNQPDNKAVLPVSSSSQMITFNFANGCVATLRASGTEPKIKYYTEICTEPAGDQEAAKKELQRLVDSIVDLWLQPEINQLVPKE